jgi:signal transduction histidine kinase
MSESILVSGVSKINNSEIFRVLTHEIATPLAALDAALILLTEDNSDDAALNSARSAAQHIAMVISRTRSQIDGNTFNSLGGSVEDVFAEIIAMLTPVVRPTGTIISVDLSEDVKLQQVPDWVLRQVVVNLVGNALKYAPGSAVTIKATISGISDVEVEVSDKGTGIPEYMLDCVTQPGFRLPQHRNIPGEGLGLSVSHQLVSSVGGSLRIKSSDEGTTVIITIPTL